MPAPSAHSMVAYASMIQPQQDTSRSSKTAAGAPPSATTALNPFLLARDRDAWSVIRGFVYQVDLTIHRWLTLSDEDALELERGEDIDIITAALSGERDASVRLLEQVKHREATLTLRTNAVREALANFFEHRSANPGTHLKFRLRRPGRSAVNSRLRCPARCRASRHG